MSQFSFPILTDKEVAQCLNELGMNASVEQLTKPTFEFVQPVYENLVTALMGVTREELQQPVFLAIDALEFPELHDESIPALAFIKYLGRLMLASGIKDFSQKDLYKPEGPRLRRNLSAIINFTKFREEKLAAYTDLQEQYEELLAGRDRAAAEHTALTAELAGLRAKREAELPQVAALEGETGALYAENQALNKQQAALSSEVRTLKQQANVITDEASGLRYKLNSAASAGELLRSQVVHSPQKLAALLDEISSAVERERGALADGDRRSRDLHARMDVIGKVEKEVQKAIGLMAEVEAAIGKKKDVSRKVKALRAEVASNEHEALQLSATHQHLKRQQVSLVDRIQRLEAQAEVKREAAESNVEEQLRDKEAIEAENAAALARLTQNEAMVRSLRERIAELQSAHSAQVGVVLEQYDALRKQVASYHGEVAAAMAAAEAKASAGSAGVAPVAAR